MAGATVATWVKVRTKTGLTSRPISHKYEGGANFAPGQIITQSEYEAIKANRGEKVSTMKDVKNKISTSPKKLSSGAITQKEIESLQSMPGLAGAYGQSVSDKGLKERLMDNSGIWQDIALSATPSDTIVVRSNGRIQGAAVFTDNPKNIYVDLLATHPQNIMGGGDAVRGAGTAALVAVAQKAHKKGKGFQLTALPSAIPFYSKLGMKQSTDSVFNATHFKVEKQDVLEFIKNNTPGDSNGK